jgi:hypothetical protein
MKRLLMVLAVVEISIATAVVVLTPIEFKERLIALSIGVAIAFATIRVAGGTAPRASTKRVKPGPVAQERPRLSQVA